MHEKKTTGLDVKCYSGSVFCLVMLLIANEREKKNVVACVKNMQYAHGYIFHFSINPLDVKAVVGEKQWRDEFLLSGLEIIETYWNRYHTEEEREIISDCKCTQQITNYNPLRFIQSAQKLHGINENPERVSVFQLSSDGVLGICELKM